jgi:hypothetical protein
MATMLPEDITGLEGVTDGEIKVFRFLREVAKPDRDFSCWYSPVFGVAGRAPDFLLFGKSLGLLVLEVKDWVLHQILAADFNRFIVRVSGKDETRTNPDKQAKGYVDALMERLRALPDFRSVVGDTAGKLKIPIGRMVVFPHIRRRDFLDREPLPFIIPPERVLFEDDIDPGGSLVADTSSQTLRKRLDAVLPFKLKPLTRQETEKLKNLIWPEFIQLPARLGEGKTWFQQEVLALDEAQARLARRLGRGHQIIKGPPGTGKTLVLVHRCCQLRRYNPHIGRIMLVCFNIALASYLKRLLQEKGIGVGERGVEVCHFYEMCAAVLDERVEFNQTDSEYYQLVIQETQEALDSGKNRLGTFGAILVDEGQDFSNEMLQVVLGLLVPGGDLILALDSYQDLYRREASWRSAGIAARGRTHYLGNVYRNTFEIFEFSQRFIGVGPKENSQARLQLDYFCHGDPPQLMQFGDFDEIEAFLETDIRNRISGGEYQRSEIGVIYDDKTYGIETFTYDSRELPRRLLVQLEAAGIPVRWVSQDVRAKEGFDITTDRVSIVSIHSAKGLDFDLVYLVGVDHILPTAETYPYLTRLLYVGLTRAKHRLIIPYIDETPFIQKMCNCLPQTP